MPRMSQHEIDKGVQEFREQELSCYERDVLAYEEGYVFPEMFPIVIYRQPSGNTPMPELKVVDGAMYVSNRAMKLLGLLGGGDYDPIRIPDMDSLIDEPLHHSN